VTCLLRKSISAQSTAATTTAAATFEKQVLTSGGSWDQSWYPSILLVKRSSNSPNFFEGGSKFPLKTAKTQNISQRAHRIWKELHPTYKEPRKKMGVLGLRPCLWTAYGLH
jgi:hypothetical protein